MKLSYQIIMAIGRDTADKRMKAEKRTEWNIEDWNHACSVTNSLFDILTKQRKGI